jgi:uncharacterized membrane-anchored protein YjiN (DUF445 family)
MLSTRQNILETLKKDGNPDRLVDQYAAIVDRADAPEEIIRAEVIRALKEYTPGGNFIPCLTYGAPGSIYENVDAIITDEINRFNRERFNLVKIK